MLAQFSCEYRLSDGLLVLDGEPPALTHPVHLDERRHVYVDLTWAGDEPARGSAVLDTGASVTVVDRGFAERHPGLLVPAGTSMGTDAGGTTVETPMAVLRGPQVLGARLDDLLVAVVDLAGANATLARPMDLILGWTALRQADWWVDHPGRRAACRRRAQYP